MPIYLILMALGNIFGVGGGSLVSRLLGAKESGRVKNVSSFSFLGCIAAGLLFTIGILVFMEPLLHVIGTSPQTIEFSRDYLRYIAYGAVSVVLSYAFGSIIRAEGASTESTIGMAIGTVVNIVLDPIMISSMRMGVASKCFIMPVLLLTGLGQGVQPFVGYNYAAKNYHRMTKSIRFFIRDDDVVRLGGGFLRAISSIGPVLGIFFVLTFVFQAIGLALPSLILSISRQGPVCSVGLFPAA